MITRLLILMAILCWAIWKLIAFVVPFAVIGVFKTSIWIGSAAYLLVTKSAQAIPGILHFLLGLSPTVWNVVSTLCLCVALAMALIYQQRQTNDTDIHVGKWFTNADKTKGIAVAVQSIQIAK